MIPLPFFCLLTRCCVMGEKPMSPVLFYGFGCAPLLLKTAGRTTSTWLQVSEWLIRIPQKLDLSEAGVQLTCDSEVECSGMLPRSYCTLLCAGVLLCDAFAHLNCLLSPSSRPLLQRPCPVAGVPLDPVQLHQRPTQPAGPCKL